MLILNETKLRVQFQDVADSTTKVLNLRSQWHLDMLKMIATFFLSREKRI
jgi:hypothetical protein